MRGVIASYVANGRELLRAVVMKRLSQRLELLAALWTDREVLRDVLEPAPWLATLDMLDEARHSFEKL